MIMKKLLFVSIIAFASLCSCTKSGFKSNDIVGEWKATKIEATLSSGKVVTITDLEEIAEELVGLEWIKVSENNIQILGDDEVYDHVLSPYEILDNYIIFDGADGDATYELKSVSRNEMIIKYTSSKWNYTSLIYYERVK